MAARRALLSENETTRERGLRRASDATGKLLMRGNLEGVRAVRGTDCSIISIGDGASGAVSPGTVGFATTRNAAGGRGTSTIRQQRAEPHR